jgi:hypothetical protein
MGFSSKLTFIFRINKNNSPFGASHGHQQTVYLSNELRNIQITTDYKTRTKNSMAEVKNYEVVDAVLLCECSHELRSTAVVSL